MTYEPGTSEVRFIPVKHGDLVLDPRHTVTHGWDRGKTYSTGTNQIIGFKPGKARDRAGWLVVLTRVDHAKSNRMRKVIRR